MIDPAPDLTAICDVLNEASDTSAGTDLIPYAQRIKAIVINALAQEADAGDVLLDEDVWYDARPDGSQMVSNYLSDWLRAHLPEATE